MSYAVASLDELDRIPVAHGLEWRPIRRRFGIRSFGVNAYTAEKPGDRVVEEHDETRLGHEELYLVVRGRARFTLDWEDLDAPAGTLVFIRDPAVRRMAIAEEEGTAVLAVGGKPGEAFAPSAWEWYFAAEPHADESRLDEAIATVRAGLAEQPENGALHYHLARYQARAGDRDGALASLHRALELRPDLRRDAEESEDLAPFAQEPGTTILAIGARPGEPYLVSARRRYCAWATRSVQNSQQ